MKLSAKQWMEVLVWFTKDPRLGVWHMALLRALVLLAYRQDEGKVLRVSRRRIMELSHVGTFPTYHKYFRELQEFGYIRYVPSYHPGYLSTVEFLFPVERMGTEPRNTGCR